VRQDLPSGTVTFLFTDVEGSTKLLHELGADAYAEALADHRRLLRQAFSAHGGVEVDTQGDAFFVSFATAPGALDAAGQAQQELAAGPIRVRMGIHTGTPHLGEEGYVGVDVHRAARIAACGHGGQVLVSASTASLLGTDGLRDLGEHRLKDLSAPERIYQLGDADFPPLESLHQTNLPIPSTPFLGREQELGEVLGLLSREDVRLLTLTGPGGTGKTRLAAQAAGLSFDHYPDGVWWVPLAPLRDPKLVLESAGQALGARNGLAEHVADRSLLLLLDNFEQVVEAATDVSSLLTSCPRLDLLVTSREPLHVTGEQEYPVPPLVHEEGVGFFLARARAVKPDLQADDAVSEICRRLDELPLALELAAARVKALSSSQILERLDQRLPLLTGGARDAPERQRTLRSTIEWSYELLTREEQRLFARLAVFSGGCTLEAAEEVAGADLDTLQSLVDKSLLRHTGERFWMLETIREYALEGLRESGEAEEVSRLHVEWFLALAEEAEPHLFGSELPEWLDRLEHEHDNLRAALDWLEGSGLDEQTLRLTAALSRFWSIRGHSIEARPRIQYALGTMGAPSPARARLLEAAAFLALDDADEIAGQRYATESMALYRELGDSRGSARALILLAQAAAEAGDYDTSLSLAEESARALSDVGDDDSFRAAMHDLGWITFSAGKSERARTLHEENLERARAAGDDRIAAASLELLALIATGEGRVSDAREMLRESYAINRRVGHPFGITFDLDYLAAAAAASDRPRVAARLLGRSDTLRSEIGIRIRKVDASVNEGTLRSIRALLNDEEVAAARAEGSEMSLDAAVEQALAAID